MHVEPLRPFEATAFVFGTLEENCKLRWEAVETDPMHDIVGGCRNRPHA